MQGRARVALALAAMLIAGCSPFPPSTLSPSPGTSTKPSSGEAVASTPPASNGPIAFVRYVGGRPSIWQIEADGSDERLFVNDLLFGIEPALSCDPRLAAITAWSPDGKWLAFAVGFGSFCGAQIGLASADGSVIRIIGEGTSFAWAPSSQELVLARTTDLGSDLRSELHFFDVEGRETRPSIGDESVSVMEPVYSPDGTRLAFAAIQSPDGDEWLTHVLDLTSADVAAARPGFPKSWLPDGSGILVSRFEQPPDEAWYTGLYLVDLADSNEVFIDKTDGGAWSPDGSQFAYFQHGKLVISSSDFRHRIELPHDGTVSGKSLSWAPDGQWLVFSLEGSADLIYVCAADGSGVRKLAEGRAAAWRPRFD
jgi:Tol biopolymer transport system component